MLLSAIRSAIAEQCACEPELIHPDDELPAIASALGSGTMLPGELDSAMLLMNLTRSTGRDLTRIVPPPFGPGSEGCWAYWLRGLAGLPSPQPTLHFGMWALQLESVIAEKEARDAS